jgi:hypothetical protein
VDIKKLLGTQVRLWAVVAVVAALGAAWLALYTGSPRQTVLRWAKGGGVQETDEFLKAINHKGDRGTWLSRVGQRPADGGDAHADYAWPHVAVYSVPTCGHRIPRRRCAISASVPK